MQDDEKIKTGVHVEKNRYLAFSIANEEFAIPLLVVKEVVALPETTRVPHTPTHFLGIMNLRGQVISIFDMRIKFNMKVENGPETAVIICDFGQLCFGVVVNSVDSVLTLSADEIKAKPDIDGRHNSEYITGIFNVAGRLILLLDIAKALNVEDRLAARTHANAT